MNKKQKAIYIYFIILPFKLIKLLSSYLSIDFSLLIPLLYIINLIIL